MSPSATSDSHLRLVVDRTKKPTPVFITRPMEIELYAIWPFRDKRPMAYEGRELVMGLENGIITNLTAVAFSPYESLEPMKPAYLLLIDVTRKGSPVFQKVELERATFTQLGEVLEVKAGQIRLTID